MGFTNIITQAGNVQGIIGQAVNFVQSVQSFFGVDVVGIYDNTSFQQVFNTARPVKANINRQRKVMEHPIESGSIVQDFAITLPVDIELSLLLASDGEYQVVYQQIRDYFLAGTFVTIQTKADVFSNMLIQGMPHEESPEMFDVIPLALKLREVQLVTVQYQALNSEQVSAPQDQSTVNTGQQQPQQSALYQAASFVGGFFK